MILADTSVWVDHFRNGNAELQDLLHNNEVLMHPFIVGELSCGTMQNRKEILRLLQELLSLRFFRLRCSLAKRLLSDAESVMIASPAEPEVATSAITEALHAVSAK